MPGATPHRRVELTDGGQNVSREGRDKVSREKRQARKESLLLTRRLTGGQERPSQTDGISNNALANVAAVALEASKEPANSWRYYPRKITTNRRFEGFILFCIGINCVLLAMADPNVTDDDFAKPFQESCTVTPINPLGFCECHVVRVITSTIVTTPHSMSPISLSCPRPHRRHHRQPYPRPLNFLGGADVLELVEDILLIVFLLEVILKMAAQTIIGTSTCSWYNLLYTSGSP